MKKKIRRTTEGLVYETDRYRTVISDSLEYILEVKHNYKYEPRKEVQLIKNYSIKGAYQIEAQNFKMNQLDSLLSWIVPR